LEILKIDLDVFISTLKLLFGYINVSNLEILLRDLNINDQIDEELLISFIDQRKEIDPKNNWDENSN
jgi:hypothetical protein